MTVLVIRLNILLQNILSTGSDTSYINLQGSFTDNKKNNIYVSNSRIW